MLSIMSHESRTAEGEALTSLILEVFRLNGRLLTAGDRLVSPLRLSSARWQVLGAISIAGSPRTVAQLARSMGLTRQGVQRVVNDLLLERLIAFMPNPDHRRAHLVILTKEGREMYAAAERLQIPWANDLSEGLDPKHLDIARNVLKDLRSRLEKRMSDEKQQSR
jgi:DNA-binding MarR family transcriptional regulator